MSKSAELRQEIEALALRLVVHEPLSATNGTRRSRGSRLLLNRRKPRR